LVAVLGLVLLLGLVLVLLLGLVLVLVLVLEIAVLQPTFSKNHVQLVDVGDEIFDTLIASASR
jgi:hypothetical protein